MIKPVSFKGSVLQHISTEICNLDDKQKLITKTELPDISAAEDKKTLENIKSLQVTDIFSAEKIKNGIKLKLTDASELETFEDSFISEKILKGKLETCSPHTAITVERIWRLFVSSDKELNELLKETNKHLVGIGKQWLGKVKK